MTAADPPQGEPHPAPLLPWYLNRTLSAAEQREVEDHLRGCAACRAELESLAELRGGMRQYWDNGTSASSAVRARILGKVQQTKVVPLTRRSTKEPGAGQPGAGPSRWRNRLHGARSLLPALAASIIVIQFGALLWIVRSAPAPAVITRGVAAEGARLKIVFRPTAAESDIRTAIQGLGARVVDGPDADRAYTLQLPPDRAKATGKQLAELGQRRDLVERLELAGP